MVLQLFLVDVHEREAVDLALPRISKEGVERTVGNLELTYLVVDSEEVVLQVVLSLGALSLALLDNFHGIGSTFAQNADPELELVLQLLAVVSISCVLQEDVFYCLAAWIHVLNTLDKALEHLEAAKLIEATQTILQQTCRVLYFLSVAKFQGLSLLFFFQFFCCHNGIYDLLIYDLQNYSACSNSAKRALRAFFRLPRAASSLRALRSDLFFSN